MTNRTLQVLITLSIVSASSFAAKERVIKFENRARVGYDDNIYQTDNKTGSSYVTDVINLSAKLNFSTRTDALLYWQPEFQYRFDADPKFVTYQDLYGRLNHAISQRMFLTLSDRFRYQQKEGQAGADGYNANFFENDLLGALDFTLNDVSYLKVGAGYEFRTWDDADYGEVQGNDFNQIKANAGYYRQLSSQKTTLMGGINYSTLDYEGNRGGYDSTALYVGADQIFNPSVTAFGRLGASFTDTDGGQTSSDSTTPYVQGGLEYTTSGRTSITGSLGYQPYRSENSFYNSQDRFNFGLGARHDITAKVSLSATMNYILSLYDGSYLNDVYGSVPDSDDKYLTLGLRCAYQINRNNFVEAGYLFRTRSATSENNVTLSDWDSNRIDLTWRLRL